MQNSISNTTKSGLSQESTLNWNRRTELLFGEIKIYSEYIFCSLYFHIVHKRKSFIHKHERIPRRYFVKKIVALVALIQQGNTRIFSSIQQEHTCFSQKLIHPVQINCLLCGKLRGSAAVSAARQKDYNFGASIYGMTHSRRKSSQKKKFGRKRALYSINLGQESVWVV